MWVIIGLYFVFKQNFVRSATSFIDVDMRRFKSGMREKWPIEFLEVNQVFLEPVLLKLMNKKDVSLDCSVLTDRFSAISVE